VYRIRLTPAESQIEKVLAALTPQAAALLTLEARQALQLLRCPTHDDRPDSEVGVDQDAKFEVVVTGCCQEAEETATGRLKPLMLE